MAIEGSSSPLAPAVTLARVLSVPRDTVQSAVDASPGITRSVGEQVLASTNLAQVQAAVGIRRAAFSPFQY